MDVLVCNGLGIWLGMKTSEFFEMKQYNWRGVWNIPSVKGKLGRIVNQFGPYSWMKYEWKPSDSLIRWIFVILMIIVFELLELGTFYLKYILWIPPPHVLVTGRLGLLWLVGAVTMREHYEYLDNPYENL